MNNKKTIQKIQDWYDEVKVNNPIQRDYIPFNLQDVQIDGKSFRVEDCTFSEDATKKLLSILNLKSDYEEYSNKMADYSLVTNKIKEAAGDRTLFGSVTTTPSFEYEITNIFEKPSRKSSLDDLCNSENNIKNIIDALAASDVDWEAKALGFDKDCSKYEIHLQNMSFPIEALKDDMWNQGHVFRFNSTEFKDIPYFERQVCTNGMMKEQLGFGTNISKMTWNNSKLAKTVVEALSSNNTDVAKMIEDYARRAQGTEISLAEFENAMKLFSEDDPAEADILVKYFNMAPFYGAYGDDIEKKSKFWKSTAKTGINAYDFVNMLTWIGSHEKDFKISKEKGDALKIHAGNLFVGKQFDLLEYAPNVEIEYPRFEIMK